jgi:dihydrofolate reductase
MTRVIFNTATTLNGFLADDDDSLDWLFTVPGADEAEGGFSGFLEGIGALVMGSTTYEWILDHEKLMDRPQKWPYQGKAAFVLSTRELQVVPGADIRLRSGEVRAWWDEVRVAAAGRDVWVVGGGDLVGQFADAELLDEIRVSIAPVTLPSGRPLLPRRLESDRLRLESVRQAGQFAELVYSVRGRSQSVRRAAS